MQLSSNQLSVLAEMGIPVWVLRDERGSEVEVAVKVETQPLDVTANVAAWIVLPTVTLNEPEQRLLNAILKAISLDMNQVSVCNVSQLEQVLKSSQPLLLFTGNLVADEKLDASPANYFVLPQLNELLQQPIKKADVWKQLRHLNAG